MDSSNHNSKTSAWGLERIEDAKFLGQTRAVSDWAWGTDPHVCSALVMLSADPPCISTSLPQDTPVDSDCT